MNVVARIVVDETFSAMAVTVAIWAGRLEDRRCSEKGRRSWEANSVKKRIVWSANSARNSLKSGYYAIYDRILLAIIQSVNCPWKGSGGTALNIETQAAGHSHKSKALVALGAGIDVGCMIAVSNHGKAPTCN